MEKQRLVAVAAVVAITYIPNELGQALPHNEQEKR